MSEAWSDEREIGRSYGWRSTSRKVCRRITGRMDDRRRKNRSFCEIRGNKRGGRLRMKEMVQERWEIEDTGW